MLHVSTNIRGDAILYKVLFDEDIHERERSCNKTKTCKYQDLYDQINQTNRGNIDKIQLIQLRLDITHVKIVGLPIPGHEDDDNLTKQNTFLELGNSDPTVFEFLEGFEKYHGSSWFSFQDEQHTSVRFKIIEEITTYWKKDKNDLPMLIHDNQFEELNPHNISVMIGYTHDLVSRQKYWYVYQVLAE